MPQAQAMQGHQQPQQLLLASQVWRPQNYTQMQMNDYHVGMGYQAAPTLPETTVIQASGRRKALLIGINYFGTNNELRGCINDVHNMRELLISQGFDKSNMVILTDDQRNPQVPGIWGVVARGARGGGRVFVRVKAMEQCFVVDVRARHKQGICESMSRL